MPLKNLVTSSALLSEYANPPQERTGVESNKEPFLYLFISGCAGNRHADSQKEAGGCPLRWFVFE